MDDGRLAKRKMRWWVPALVLVVLGGLAGWLHVTEHVARYVATVLVVILAVLVLSLWYIFLTQLPWRRRLAYFGVWVVVLAGAWVCLATLTRWEGSMGGGAIPRLVWKGAEPADVKLEELAPSGGAATMAESSAAFAQFLGPQRNGSLPGAALDPDWAGHPPEELWRIEVGAGWSGFAVAAGRAVTQEQRGEKEMITCYDLASGEPLWAHGNEARFSETMGGDGPRATPTIHPPEADGKVYVMGATGILDCLELVSGALVWSRNILEEHGARNVMYGKACSPLIVQDGESPELVVVTGGERPGPTLLAYDRMSGEPVWTAGKDAASYASPLVTTLAGKRQIVCVNANTVTGHDISTGEILWAWDWAAKMPKSALAQPVGGDRLLVTASYGMGSAVIEIGGGPDGFTASKVWKNIQMKTKFSNVCVKDGYAYGLDEGRLACLEVDSGKRKWKGSNYGYGQNLRVGEHILVQAERGYVVLVEASPEKFTEVARLEALDGKTWNNPALAGEYLLVRNDREAVCFRVKLR